MRQLDLISFGAEKGRKIEDSPQPGKAISPSSVALPSETLLGFGKEIKIKGHRVGHLDNSIFIADRELSKKFRQYNGWGISKQLIRELVETSTKLILFRIKDEGSLVYTLEVQPRNWLSRGIEYHNPALNEDQLVLPETSFDRKTFTSVRTIR